MKDHPEARAMINDSEVALKPVLELYKHLVDPKVWEQHQEGLVSAIEVVWHTFDRLTND